MEKQLKYKLIKLIFNIQKKKNMMLIIYLRCMDILQQLYPHEIWQFFYNLLIWANVFPNRCHCIPLRNGYCISWIFLSCSNFDACKLYGYSNRVEVMCIKSYLFIYFPSLWWITVFDFVDHFTTKTFCTNIFWSKNGVVFLFNFLCKTCILTSNDILGGQIEAPPITGSNGR